MRRRRSGDSVRRALGVALVAALAIALTAGACAGVASARDRFDVRVLAPVPAPGYPGLSLVAPDRTIYVGTFTNAAGSDTGPSKVFAFTPDGHLTRTYTIEGQTPGSAHGVQVAARDAHGLLYLLDQNPARVITLDPATGHQQTYATFHDVPTCATSPAAAPECSDTVQDNPPEPDYAAFGPDGAMYVTDYQQGLIWRVPPGGGAAKVWFTDPQIDGAIFGPAGIVLMPDHRTLMFSTSSGGVTTPGNASTGKLYKLPIGPGGAPGTLTKVYESGPREAPDGFALAASGDIYLALVGPGVNQIVEISPNGVELGRAPATAAANAQQPVPFDEPSSVQFDGDRMIVTNDAYFSGNQSNMVLFDVFAGEPGAPVYVPPAAATPPAPTGTGTPRPRYRMTIRPGRVRRGRHYRFRVHLTVRQGAKVRPVRGAVITLGGRRARTDAHGNAAIDLTIARGHHYRAVALVGRRRVTAIRLRLAR